MPEIGSITTPVFRPISLESKVSVILPSLIPGICDPLLSDLQSR
jgi:hypothetical protein